MKKKWILKDNLKQAAYSAALFSSVAALVLLLIEGIGPITLSFTLIALALSWWCVYLARAIGERGRKVWILERVFLNSGFSLALF